MSKSNTPSIPLTKDHRAATFLIIKPDAFTDFDKPNPTRKIIDQETKQEKELPPEPTQLKNVHNALFELGTISYYLHMEKPEPKLVEQHLQDVLKEHGEDAYNRNYSFYSKGPLALVVLRSNVAQEKQEDYIKRVRTAVGATDPSKASPGTIRSLSKDSLENAIQENRGLRNLVHASDSPASYLKETSIWKVE